MTNDSSGKDKLRIALIATYPEMAKVCESLVLAEGLHFENHFAAFDDAVRVAKQVEPHIDAILSRGGTGRFIQLAVNVPLIQIPISPFDVVTAMQQVPDHFDEVAFFCFDRKIYGIRVIEKMYRKTIREYTFIDGKDIVEGVRDVKRRGIKMLVGGVVAVELARELGIEGVEVSSGEEAVYRAVQEAIRVIQVRRTERRAATRLEAAFDAIAEGVVITDEHERVTVFNPAAQRIFHTEKYKALGQNIRDIIPHNKIPPTLEGEKPGATHLQKIHGALIAASRLPVCLEGVPIGVVSTYEDVTKIQHLEQTIRKQINAKGFAAKYRFEDILTKNTHVAERKRLAALYAQTDSSVLIQGESGTGKELFAQSIHNASRRANGPFVAVNCAAIPEHLLESELFGYEGGAFTGARKEGRQGLFELAHRGTIFLDEIGEIPKSLQARLLRVLQEREIMRVGGDKIVPVDIRIISATNKHLEKKVELDEFRNDLYYRLNTFNLMIPPLRERKDDIPLFIAKFLGSFNVSVDQEGSLQELSSLLAAYDWPGNIRELASVMERLSLLIRTGDAGLNWDEMLRLVMPAMNRDETILNISVRIDQGLKQAVNQVESAIIHALLTKHGHDRESVARILRIGKATIWRKAPAKSQK